MIHIDAEPVAVKFLEDLPSLEMPSRIVRSFCEALGLVRDGEFPDGLLVTPETVATCVWSPVALGFREPLGAADGTVPSVHPRPVAGVVLYRYDQENLPQALREIAVPPDSLVLISDEDNTRAIVETLGPDAFDTQFADQQAFSASALFVPGSAAGDERSVSVRDRRARRTWAINRIFGANFMQKESVMNLITRMMGKTWMQNLMTWLSMGKTSACASCLASTSIPRVSSKAHIGFVDSGTVAWGHVRPDRFLIGVTPQLYDQLRPVLTA